MAPKQHMRDANSVAKLAIQALGCGYDLTHDLRFSSCKSISGTSLIDLNDEQIDEMLLPGGLIVPNVSKFVKCDKGDRTHFRSDILPFNQMSEQFNQGLSLSGKIPSGFFNSMFNFTGAWQKDALATKSLVLDGWFYTLYTVELPRSQLTLKEHVRTAVPASWDPSALARFIETYGTHIILGVKVGGKDVIYVKQHQSSTLSSAELQRLLTEVSDERFSYVEGRISTGSRNYQNREKVGRANHLASHLDTSEAFSQLIYHEKQGVTIIPRRKGGDDRAQDHCHWLHTVPVSPDVISMTFVPIPFLLNGVTGSGFLSHAMNLYLRYKPPIEELHLFLEFQLPRQWAPIFNELPLSLSRKERSPPTLQFSLMGPKLQVNNMQVTVGKKPVTGLRLYLEGKRCNKLAIHLQHLSAVPKVLQPLWEGHPLVGEPTWQDPEEANPKYFEPVLWKSFSHVCTAPVENSETWIGDAAGAYVVVGAQLGVISFGIKSVLYLRLLYSKIPEVQIRRSEWDHMPASSQKTGLFSSLMSTTFTSNPPPRQVPSVVINSNVYPEGPPKPVQVPKLLKYIDTTEMTKGPHDMPGHWVVTGAKLYLDKRKISLRVKYSLLNISYD